MPSRAIGAADPGPCSQLSGALRSTCTPDPPRREDPQYAASDLANQDFELYTPIERSALTGAVIGDGARFAIA
jgi:hypothetical protein